MTRSRLFLLCVSNLLAAFGGGAILSKAMGLLKAEPLLQGESPLAFLFGTIVGLVLLVTVPANWKRKGVAGFSLGASCLSVLLLWILHIQQDSPLKGRAAWAFLAVLCVHFGCWTTARGLRSDICSGMNQKLSWIELSYYLGVILGLGAEKLGLDDSRMGITEALTLNVLLQAVAAIIDQVALHGLKNEYKPQDYVKTHEFDWWRYAKLTASIALLTAGIEALFFGLVHRVQNDGNKVLSAEIWAVSYAGPALAALLGAITHVKLEWPPGGWLDAGAVQATNRWRHWRVPLSLIIWFSGALMGLIALAPCDRDWDRIVILSSAVAVFFAYEIAYLAIGDRIGIEAKAAKRDGMVAVTLGVMGLAAAFATIAVIHDLAPSWLFWAAAPIGACLVMATSNVQGDVEDRIVLKVDPPLVTAEKLAAMLVQERKLASYAYYALPPSSAFWWAAFSRDEVEIRKRYEAGAWQALGLKKYLLEQSVETQGVGVVGLAVGEGAGEIELLHRALDDLGPDGCIHYLAIDTSPGLLLVHLHMIREQLAPYLRAGRLVVGIVQGDIHNLSPTLDQARESFEARGIAFLPKEFPVLVTCLGNVLGNEIVPANEASLMCSVRDQFPGRKLAILAGVSVRRPVRDDYNPEWYEFLMRPARYLTEDLALLVSVRLDSDPESPFEFVLPKDQQSRKERFQEEVVELDPGSAGRGSVVHQFLYTLQHDLRLPDQGLTLAAGTQLLLYSVTKYNPQALTASLGQYGFRMVYREDYHQFVESSGEVREYAVFAAFSV